MFSNLKREIKTITIRGEYNFNKKISLISYLEFFSNYDQFDNSSYYEYMPSTNTYEETNYILGKGDWNGMPVYSQDLDVLQSALSYVDPNLYLGLYPKYMSSKLNTILKWNYMKGSNFYLVYSSNKSVNGKYFNPYNELVDFMSFNEKNDWVEVFRDQAIMIKIDYWFEK